MTPIEDAIPSLVDILVIGDKDFEQKFSSKVLADSKDYRLVEDGKGPTIIGPNGFIGRLYHAERDAKTPLVILAQNDPPFQECFPLPYAEDRDIKIHNFCDGNELYKLSTLCRFMSECQEQFQDTISKALDSEYHFSFPAAFYDILDFTYFSTISAYISQTRLGMLVRKGNLGTYALLSMELSTDDAAEEPLIIFSTITLK